MFLSFLGLVLFNSFNLTQFNNSLHSYNQVDTPFCNTCTKELNEEHTEDYLHTNYTCSSTQTVINETTTVFFPEIDTPFDKKRHPTGHTCWQTHTLQRKNRPHNYWPYMEIQQSLHNKLQAKKHHTFTPWNHLHNKIPNKLHTQTAAT